MKKFGAKGIVGLIFEGLALIFLSICIATDINDDLFLPLALGCVIIGSLLSFLLQLEVRKRNQNKTDVNTKNKRSYK